MLIVIDPTARRTDGESVRIARDVLCAGTSGAKICVLEQPQAIGQALARRGSRRVVIVGDDRTLLRAVGVLHRSGELPGSPLAMVPVGPGPTVAVARALGVPTEAVAASRTVLSGTDRPLDLLTDDAGGVVLGTLSIPAPRPPTPPRLGWLPLRAGHRHREGPAAAEQRLRVVAGSTVLTDVDTPVGEVSVQADGGLAEVVVRRPQSAARRGGGNGSPGSGAAARSAQGRGLPGRSSPGRNGDADRGANGTGRGEGKNGESAEEGDDVIRARALSVTVSGPAFSYRANAAELGPTHARTWTVLPQALRLTMPNGAQPAAVRRPGGSPA